MAAPGASRRLARIAIPALACAIAGGGRAHASGFLLHEQTAEALGRAGAVSAGTSEPAAVWFNPAALAFAPATGAQLTLAVARAHTRFSPQEGGLDVESIPKNNLVPALFAHGRVHERVTLGLGLYAPFGLTVTWPEGWVGERSSLETRLWALALNPVVAVRLEERVSLAAGWSGLRGGAHFVQGLGPLVGGKAEFNGGAWGWGWNVALLLRQPSDVVRVALGYRSRVDMHFTGDADFSPQSTIFSGLLQDGPAKSDVTLPDVFTAAVAVRPLPRLELGAELTMVRWSTFDHLEIERGDLVISIDRGSRDPLTARLGGELWLPASALALRAGAFFEQSASDPEHLGPAAPDARRLGLCAGLGYLLGPAKIDLGYLYGHFLPAESNSPNTQDGPPRGTYRTRIQALSLSVTVRR